jgi:hypothetical protein
MVGKSLKLASAPGSTGASRCCSGTDLHSAAHWFD